MPSRWVCQCLIEPVLYAIKVVCQCLIEPVLYAIKVGMSVFNRACSLCHQGGCVSV